MARALFLLVLAAAALAAIACGGDDFPNARVVVIDQNILHGIINEDEAAEPYDRFPERLPLIAAALAEAGPDVIFLQEVLTQAPEDYPNVRADLLRALGSDYTAVFGNIGGDAIDTPGLGQMTLTRLPVLSSANRHLAGVRSVQHIAVETEVGTVDLYNVHLEGTGAVIEAGQDEAVVEINAVLDFIEETRSGGPVIIAGDFNAEPGDASIRTLLDAGYVDALARGGDATCERAGDPGCTNGTIPLGDNQKNLAERRIDYIFVLPSGDLDIEVTEAALFNNEPADIAEGHTLWPSDHIGVRAVVVLD